MLCVSLYHGDLYSSLWKSHLYLRPPIFSVLDMIKQGLFIKELCPAMNNDRGPGPSAYMYKQWVKQGLSQDLITGEQFVPLAKIVGDIFIFRGTEICTPFCLCKGVCLLSRASDRSRKKKSNFAGFLGTNLREFSGQTSPKSNR